MSMRRARSVTPIWLDVENELVWQGDRTVRLTPKAFAVLGLLVEHAGRLVTKETLFSTLWPDVVVSDDALLTCIAEIRKRLGDRARAPHCYIETVHRRGYRFIGPLEHLAGRSEGPESQPAIVGRETEIEHQCRWLEKARRGNRQIVFVTGESGIGKTAVVQAFLARAAAARDVWTAQGQCVEHYGQGEAYLPVLEALSRVCRTAQGKRLRAVLRQYAPTWLVQMPWLVKAAELNMLQRHVLGATRDRMLREIAEAFETLTGGGAIDESPVLVLVLEDLHWSDHATLELLEYLARRPGRARLLVIGTYRPVDAILREHPVRAVKEKLQVHGQCEELPLKGLSAAAVGTYVVGRFPGGAPTGAALRSPEIAAGRSPLDRVAQVIHRRTEGNPLFMVAVTDTVVAQGLLVEREAGWELSAGIEQIERAIPVSARQVIEQQLERLTATDQRVLEAGSVAGVEFSAAAVGAAIEEPVEAVEDRCARLVRYELFLRAAGNETWPDGTVTARYRSPHALYRHVLYERIPTTRRSRCHQRIGERKERGYGKETGEIAAELAVHFEQGRDYHRAVHYLQQAGENALRLSAHVEAITLLTRGLELLQMLPDTPERAHQELGLQVTLGVPLTMTKGYADSTVESAYTRAQELCRQVGETPQLFPVLGGLFAFYVVRAELHKAYGLGEQMLAMAQRVQDPVLFVAAHQTLGTTLFHRGALIPARVHLEQGIARYDLQHNHAPVFLHGLNHGVFCRVFAALVLWSLGYPNQALKRWQEALTLAEEVAHPLSTAYTFFFGAWLHQVRREPQAAQGQAETAMTFSEEQGFAMFLALATTLRGWARTEQEQAEEGIAQILQGLAAFRHTGAQMLLPYFSTLLADAYGKVGRVEEGRTLLAEALAIVDKTGERFWEPELHRIEGELILKSEVKALKTRQGKSRVTKKSSESGVRRPEIEAEACFQRAMGTARHQSAKSLELRVVMSLSRLWQQQGKRKEAQQMLAEMYGWFTEGFDTPDLKDARALLDELSQEPSTI